MSKLLIVSLVLAISSMVFVDVCNAKVNIFDINRMGAFKAAVLQNQKPVVVYFTKSTCQPCQSILTDLENTARANENEMYLARVDVDESPEMREQFKITKVPRTQTYFRGELISQLTGPNRVGIEGITNYLLKKAREAGKNKQ